MKENLLKQIARGIAKRFSGLFLVNNASYWDRYVLEWKLSGKRKKYGVVGNEWKGEEIFLDILSRFSQDHPTALEIGVGGGE